MAEGGYSPCHARCAPSAKVSSKGRRQGQIPRFQAFPSPCLPSGQKGCFPQQPQVDDSIGREICDFASPPSIPFETCPQQPPVEFTTLLVGHRSDGLVWVCGSHPRRNVLLSAKVEHLRKPSGLRREGMESTGEIGIAVRPVTRMCDLRHRIAV